MAEKTEGSFNDYRVPLIQGCEGHGDACEAGQDEKPTSGIMTRVFVEEPIGTPWAARP